MEESFVSVQDAKQKRQRKFSFFYLRRREKGASSKQSSTNEVNAAADSASAESQKKRGRVSLWRSFFHVFTKLSSHAKSSAAGRKTHLESTLPLESSEAYESREEIGSATISAPTSGALPTTHGGPNNALAMAITLPKLVKGGDIKVSLELKAISKGNEELFGADCGLTMKEKTPERTVYSGNVKVPLFTTILEVSRMPLYLLSGDCPEDEHKVETIITPLNNVLPETYDHNTVINEIHLKICFDNVSTPNRFHAERLSYTFLSNGTMRRSLNEIKPEAFVDQITEKSSVPYDESSKLIVKEILNQVVSKISVQSSTDLIQDFHKELEAQKVLLLKSSTSILPNNDSLLPKISESDQENLASSSTASNFQDSTDKLSDSCLYPTTEPPEVLKVPANTPHEFILSSEDVNFHVYPCFQEVCPWRWSNKKEMSDEVKADIDRTLELLETAKNKLICYLNQTSLIEFPSEHTRSYLNDPMIGIKDMPIESMLSSVDNLTDCKDGNINITGEFFRSELSEASEETSSESAMLVDLQLKDNLNISEEEKSKEISEEANDPYSDDLDDDDCKQIPNLFPTSEYRQAMSEIEFSRRKSMNTYLMIRQLLEKELDDINKDLAKIQLSDDDDDSTSNLPDLKLSDDSKILENIRNYTENRPLREINNIKVKPLLGDTLEIPDKSLETKELGQRIEIINIDIPIEEKEEDSTSKVETNQISKMPEEKLVEMEKNIHNEQETLKDAKRNSFGCGSWHNLRDLSDDETLASDCDNEKPKPQVNSREFTCLHRHETMNDAIFRKRYSPEARGTPISSAIVTYDINTMLQEMLHESYALKESINAKFGDSQPAADENPSDFNSIASMDVKHILDDLINKVDEESERKKRFAMDYARPQPGDQVYQVKPVYYCLIEDAPATSTGNYTPLTWVANKLKRLPRLTAAKGASLSVRRHSARNNESTSKPAQNGDLVGKLERGITYMHELCKEIYTTPLSMVQFGQCDEGCSSGLKNTGKNLPPLVRKSKNLITLEKKVVDDDDDIPRNSSKVEVEQKVINPEYDDSKDLELNQGTKSKQPGQPEEPKENKSSRTLSWKQEWKKILNSPFPYGDTVEGMSIMPNVQYWANQCDSGCIAKKYEEHLNIKRDRNTKKKCDLQKRLKLAFSKPETKEAQNLNMEQQPETSNDAKEAINLEAKPSQMKFGISAKKSTRDMQEIVNETEEFPTTSKESKSMLVLHENPTYSHFDSTEQIVLPSVFEDKSMGPVADIPRRFESSGLEANYLQNIKVLQDKMAASVTRPIASSSSSDLILEQSKIMQNIPTTSKVETVETPDSSSPNFGNFPMGIRSSQISNVNRLEYSTDASVISSRSGTAPRSADYFADTDLYENVLPNLRLEYNSQVELNGPEDIKRIEENVLKNKILNPVSIDESSDLPMRKDKHKKPIYLLISDESDSDTSFSLTSETSEIQINLN